MGQNVLENRTVTAVILLVGAMKVPASKKSSGAPWKGVLSTPAAVAKALRTVDDDRAHLAALGRAARERYEAHPHWNDSMGERRVIEVAVADSVPKVE